MVLFSSVIQLNPVPRRPLPIYLHTPERQLGRTGGGLDLSGALDLTEALGLDALHDEPKAFVQLEQDHETYFLRKVTGHSALPFWQRLFKRGPVLSARAERAS